MVQRESAITAMDRVTPYPGVRRRVSWQSVAPRRIPGLLLPLVNLNLTQEIGKIYQQQLSLGITNHHLLL